MGRGGGHGGGRAGGGGSGGALDGGSDGRVGRADGNGGRDGGVRADVALAEGGARPNESGGLGGGDGNDHGANPLKKTFIPRRFDARAAHDGRKHVADAKAQGKHDERARKSAEAALARERKLARKPPARRSSA